MKVGEDAFFFNFFGGLPIRVGRMSECNQVKPPRVSQLSERALGVREPETV